MSDPSPKDLTPESSSPTDIAPLGRDGLKPSHERTAIEEAGTEPWQAIADDPAFKALLIAKAKFVVPMTIFFVIYYFTLPVLVGWFPEMMSREVWGSVNWAYLFALSQFFMAWIVAFFYVAAAVGWDKRVSEILGRFGR
ncbi:MAG: DUF485 domain-containing protein [Terrimicrobiaceae bacterium]